MSNTIWKYKLPRDGEVITIEEYIIEPLRVECQNGVPTLWAVVNPEKKCYLTEIVAWGTGWDLPDDIYYGCEYFGTCEDGYGFVWHYFAKVHQVNSQTTDTLTT